jgi:hypothetical protein
MRNLRFAGECYHKWKEVVDAILLSSELCFGSSHYILGSTHNHNSLNIATDSGSALENVVACISPFEILHVTKKDAINHLIHNNTLLQNRCTGQTLQTIPTINVPSHTKG